MRARISLRTLHSSRLRTGRLLTEPGPILCVVIGPPRGENGNTRELRPSADEATDLSVSRWGFVVPHARGSTAQCPFFAGDPWVSESFSSRIRGSSRGSHVRGRGFDPAVHYDVSAPDFGRRQIGCSINPNLRMWMGMRSLRGTLSRSFKRVAAPAFKPSADEASEVEGHSFA